VDDARRRLASLIRDVPDFPKPGIVFKDITPLLAHPDGLRAAVDLLVAPHRDAAPTHVVAVESRGFIFGAAAACALGAGFVPVRKRGKLPWRTDEVTYALEYGTDTLQMHQDAFERGGRVLIVDDVIATGGTLVATADLVRRQGATVLGAAVVVELGFLGGRERIAPLGLTSVLSF
jgi:adenine phosphoribosyltransferase